MPIPPRPIPIHHRSHYRSPGPTSHSHSQCQISRPGYSVPRKLGHSSGNGSDWRAEVALLGDAPRSVPVNELSGVRLVPDKPVINVEKPSDHGEEVDLDHLIEVGKGKREKRATTATTLGFDFIPKPSVLVLPDTEPGPRTSESPISAAPESRPAPVPQSRTSLLSRSPFSLLQSRYSPASHSELARTPSTPGLLPAQSGSSDVEEDEDDEEWEWERIEMNSKGDAEVDREDEGDLIMVGEMELESELSGNQAGAVLDDKSITGMKNGVQLPGRGRVSYAAALGATSRKA